MLLDMRCLQKRSPFVAICDGDEAMMIRSHLGRVRVSYLVRLTHWYVLYLRSSHANNTLGHPVSMMKSVVDGARRLDCESAAPV